MMMMMTIMMMMMMTRQLWKEIDQTQTQMMKMMKIKKDLSLLSERLEKTNLQNILFLSLLAFPQQEARLLVRRIH